MNVSTTRIKRAMNQGRNKQKDPGRHPGHRSSDVGGDAQVFSYRGEEGLYVSRKEGGLWEGAKNRNWKMKTEGTWEKGGIRGLSGIHHPIAGVSRHKSIWTKSKEKR